MSRKVQNEISQGYLKGSDLKEREQEVLTYDVQTAIDALISSVQMTKIDENSDSLSDQLKSSGLLTVDQLEKAESVRRRLLKHNAPRIEHRFYLANTIWRKALLVKARI